jgi:hypothetical protein
MSRATSTFLFGLAISCGLFAALLFLMFGNPLYPMSVFACGLGATAWNFERLYRNDPKSNLAIGYLVPFMTRQIIFFVGMGASLIYMFLVR